MKYVYLRFKIHDVFNQTKKFCKQLSTSTFTYIWPNLKFIKLDGGTVFKLLIE